MNKQKLTYLSPETETLVVRFEGVVCTSPLKTLGMMSIGGGADDGFGDSAAEVQDLSDAKWW